MTQERFKRIMWLMALGGIILFVVLNRIIPNYCDCETSIALLTAVALLVNAISCAVAASLGRKLVDKNSKK